MLNGEKLELPVMRIILSKVYLLLVFSSLITSVFAQEGKTALMVLDMQSEFVKRKGNQNAPSNVKKLQLLLENQIAAIKAAMEADIPIMHVEYEGYGETLSPLAELLETYPKTTKFMKTKNSLFSNKSLSFQSVVDYLVTENLSSFLIIGANGAYCIQDTIQFAVLIQFQVYTYSLGVADFNHLEFQYPYASREQAALAEYSFTEFSSFAEVDEFLDRAASAE